MSWDNKYKGNNRVWGDDPSELATLAVKYLQAVGLNDERLSILDVGCGYGRDASFLSQHLKCKVLGIDPSQEAIKMAKETCAGQSGIEFRQSVFTEIDGGAFDVILASNLYHLLKTGERQSLRETIKRLLDPGGLLFLGALSTNDPQGYGKGVPVPGKAHTFEYKGYSHFFTRDELRQDFGFLTIRELYEHEYYEARARGEAHHHILWVLVGRFGIRQGVE